MKSKQAYYSEEALDEVDAPREDCTAVKGCIYSRFVFLWVCAGGLQCCSLKKKKWGHAGKQDLFDEKPQCPWNPQ